MLLTKYYLRSYNTSNNDYSDIAYICVECKKDLDDNALPHCNDCGRVMRNRIDVTICNMMTTQDVKTI